MKEFGDGFDGELFSTLIDIVAETAIVSFHTLPVGFPLPTISKNSLSTVFCSLILDHGVSLMISMSGAKILISYVLLDTSFDHRFQNCVAHSSRAATQSDMVTCICCRVTKSDRFPKVLTLSFLFFLTSDC